MHPALRRRPMPVNGEIAHLIAPAITTDAGDPEYAPAPALSEHTAAIRAEFEN